MTCFRNRSVSAPGATAPSEATVQPSRRSTPSSQVTYTLSSHGRSCTYHCGAVPKTAPNLASTIASASPLVTSRSSSAFCTSTIAARSRWLSAVRWPMSRRTAAWAAVFLIWAGPAGGLAALRQRERAAIVEVQKAELERDVTNGEALAMVLARFGAVLGTAPQWYVQDRPWEDKVYVTWELGVDLRLGWTVAYDGAVAPGAETELLLKQVVRAGEPQSGPALPPGL